MDLPRNISTKTTARRGPRPLDDGWIAPDDQAEGRIPGHRWWRLEASAAAATAAKSGAGSAGSGGRSEIFGRCYGAGCWVNREPPDVGAEPSRKPARSSHAGGSD